MVYLTHPHTGDTRTCEGEAHRFERVSHWEWARAKAIQDDAGRERNREADQDAERAKRRRE